MTPSVKSGLGGAAGGLVAALLITFVLPSDHSHELSDIWTDHLLLFTLLPVGCFIGALLGGRKGRR